jgi:hypothetical protein
MRDYFEQILNALVYALCLPEDAHAGGPQKLHTLEPVRVIEGKA